MSRLKLAMVMNSRLQKHGSFEDFMIFMARCARERNWDLSLVLPAIETPEVARLIEGEQADLRVIPVPWRSRAGISALNRELAEISPHVVNFHFCESPHLLPVYLACRMRGMRIVSHYHGEIRPLSLLGWRNRHFSLLRVLSVFTNQIVAVSLANKRFLEVLHVVTPVEVIYNGIDTTNFLRNSDPQGLNRQGTDNHPVEFLYIGQLIQRKQVSVLIRAFASMHTEVPSAHLTIIGSGPEEERCRRLASTLGVTGSIEFAGLISQYPFEQLRHSDVLVSASDSESFGLVFAEAMCMGLPVIACRVGGIPEVVDDHKNGLLVPPHDSAALAAAMLTLARQPELRRQMGAYGCQRARERFDLTDKVAATMDLFERVVACV